MEDLKGLVRIKGFSGGYYVRRKLPVKPETFGVECPYSYGEAKDPGSFPDDRDCPVCQGTGHVILTGFRDEYKYCIDCDGTGRDLSDITDIRPCRICRGTGLVRIELSLTRESEG